MGAQYDKEELHSKWTEARERSMSAPQAYQQLVALYLSLAQDIPLLADGTEAPMPLESGSGLSPPTGAGNYSAQLKVLPRWCMLECDLAANLPLDLGLAQSGKNDEGLPVSLGINSGCTKYYCGRILGKDLILGSDGQCGPRNGPQCASCRRFQDSLVSWDSVTPDQAMSSATEETDRHEDRRVLWFGDVPASVATPKLIEEMVGRCKPRTMPPPFVSKVVKKAYRAPVPDADVQQGPWLGFAIIAFRDFDEAVEALQSFQGVDAGSGWTMCVKWADPCFQTSVKEGRRKGPRLASGKHPPLGEQLFPISFQGSDLAAAVKRHLEFTKVPVRAISEHWIVAEVVKAYYREFPRQEIKVVGHPIPSRVRNPLLMELERTRWPAALHRFGMQSEQYLVLHRGGGARRRLGASTQTDLEVNDGYEKLLSMLEMLLTWADPAFGCNKIAVTRGFQGSPHIDSSDACPQYCCSLGNFDYGGELCIEGMSPGEVYIVDTHDRMAKVDGRRVHWVRGHSGGTRYSVIFFATNPSQYADLRNSFYDDFVPHGCTEHDGCA